MTFTTINFGEEVKELKFKHKQLRILEETGGQVVYGQGVDPEKAGKPIGWIDVIVSLGRPSVLTWAIWLGLLRDNPKITRDQVDDLIDNYTEADNPDNGTRLEKLIEDVASSILKGYGLDPNPIMAGIKEAINPKKPIQRENPGAGNEQSVTGST